MSRRSRDTAASNTYRFFVDPAAFQGDRVQLSDPELARQLGGVLRLGAGDRVTLLDGAGWLYVVVLEQVDRRGAIVGAVERREPATGAEPRVHLTLYLPLIRPERFEWALQKGVELGVAAFVPTLCAHSRAEGEPAARKLNRWRTIVREAAEQSRRGILPRLDAPMPFADACARAAGTRAFLLWEGQGAEGLRPAQRALLIGDDRRPTTDDRRPTNDDRRTTNDERAAADARESAASTSGARWSVVGGRWSILSGPEGGLAEDERRAAAAHGIMSVSLGPRTLRAETAPIVAATAILYELGELE
jgi:16S rRNA (uracil1498-N3)-methyltransferase